MKELTEKTFVKLKEGDYFVAVCKDDKKNTWRLWLVGENKVAQKLIPKADAHKAKIDGTWNFNGFRFYKITEQEARDYLFMENL